MMSCVTVGVVADPVVVGDVVEDDRAVSGDQVLAEAVPDRVLALAASAISSRRWWLFQ